MEYEVIENRQEKRRKKATRDKERKLEIYKSLYFDYKYGFEHMHDAMKCIYYGIKYYSRQNVDNYSYKELLVTMSEVQDIKMLIAGISYSDMLKLFPVHKVYDGEKYSAKDYFSTMEYLKDLDWFCSIGVDNVDDFFWSYYNLDIMNFSVFEMLVLDRIRKFEGRGGLFEAFLKECNLQDQIHTYSLNKEEGVLVDNQTGEIIKVEVPKQYEKTEDGFVSNAPDKVQTMFQIVKPPAN